MKRLVLLFGFLLLASSASAQLIGGGGPGGGGGGSGTVPTGAVGQTVYYAASGNALTAINSLTTNISAAPYNAKCDSTSGTNGTDDSAAIGLANATGGAYGIATGTNAAKRKCKSQGFWAGPGSLGITSITVAAGTATVVTDAPFFDLLAGTSVTFKGTSQATCNATFVVGTVTGTTGFTFPAGSCVTATGGVTSWSGVGQTWDGGNKVTTEISMQGQSGGQTTSLDNACIGNADGSTAGGEAQFWNVLDVKVSNLTFRNYGTHTGGAGLACLLGIGNQPVNARVHFFDVDVDPNESASANSPLCIWAGSGLDSLTWDGGSISNFTPGQACSQSIFITGSQNNVDIRNMNLYPNADNTISGGTVAFGGSPQLQLSNPSGGCSSCNFSNIRLTRDYNGVEFDGASQAHVDNVYGATLGAEFNSTNKVHSWWKPGDTIVAGDLLAAPSTTFTGTCTNGNGNITGISNTGTLGLFQNEPVTVPCGAANANVDTYITSVVSTTAITVHTASACGGSCGASTLAVPAPNMHIYRARTGGTNGTQPTWVTTYNRATNTDGTITWVEYGLGGMIEDKATQPVTIADSQPFRAVFGVVGLSATTMGVNGIECSARNIICIEASNGLGGGMQNVDIESVFADIDIAGVFITGSSTIDWTIEYTHITTATGRPLGIWLDASTAGYLITNNPVGGLAASLSRTKWVTLSQPILQTQFFSGSGTYTPDLGTAYALVEAVGGGAGGGGTAGNVSNDSGAGGGGAGEYCRGLFSAATIGANQTVTIGGSASGGASGNNPGTAGNATSFGALLVANGGTGGGGGPAAGGGALGGGGGTGGTSPTGGFCNVGNAGMSGIGGTITTISAVGGAGGGSVWGGASTTRTAASGACSAGQPSGNFGGGGGGAACDGNATGAAGGSGSGGALWVEEIM